LESALSAASNSAPPLSSLATVYAGLGQIDKAVSMARRATELVPVSADALEGPIYVRALAMVYAQVGQQDQAIELAAYLLTIPSNVSVNALRLMPEFTPLHDNPRFQALLKEYEKEHGF
jgi:tetratricopeptide (TPR) repeat protein